MSWRVSPWIYPVWDSLCFLDLTVSFPMLGKFSAIISSNIFSGPFSVFSFWDPYNVNIVAFNVVSVVPETVLISFILFSLFCSMQ